jgi:hypothetical protein
MATISRGRPPRQPFRLMRRDLEARLSSLGWPWHPGASRWLDALVIAEEGGHATWTVASLATGSR